MTTYEAISILIQSAIGAGTIGAVITALYLANRSTKPKMEIIPSISYEEDLDGEELDKPTWFQLHIINTGSMDIRIVGILYSCGKYGNYITANFWPRRFYSDGYKHKSGNIVIRPSESFDHNIKYDDCISALELSYSFKDIRGVIKYLPRNFQKVIYDKLILNPKAVVILIGENREYVDISDFIKDEFKKLLNSGTEIPRKESIQKLRSINIVEDEFSNV